ncbi:MAG: type II secretion system protein [Planctomycetes bacterium]|nr:type II secretion system protein [Planctomycetota bacterium]
MNMHDFNVRPMAKQKAFTLIEILIVVSILGILAAIVAPQFSQSSTKAKEAVAKELLQTLRTQLELFKIHHNGLKAGHTTLGTQFDGLVYLHLYYYSSATGACSSVQDPVDVYKFGPYLKARARNPFNKEFQLLTFYDAADEALPTGSTGWIYNAVTGSIHIDWPGTDSKGVAYYDY